MINIGSGSIAESDSGPVSSGSSEVEVRVTAALAAGAALSSIATRGLAATVGVAATAATSLSVTEAVGRLLGVVASCAWSAGGSAAKVATTEISAACAVAFRTTRARAGTFTLAAACGVLSKASAAWYATPNIVAGAAVDGRGDLGYPSERLDFVTQSVLALGSTSQLEVPAKARTRLVAFHKPDEIVIMRYGQR